jgi:hypothetical protein
MICLIPWLDPNSERMEDLCLVIFSESPFCSWRSIRILLTMIHHNKKNIPWSSFENMGGIEHRMRISTFEDMGCINTIQHRLCHPINPEIEGSEHLSDFQQLSSAFNTCSLTIMELLVFEHHVEGNFT